jgi:hypothetical protein
MGFWMPISEDRLSRFWPDHLSFRHDHDWLGLFNNLSANLWTICQTDPVKSAQVHVDTFWRRPNEFESVFEKRQSADEMATRLSPAPESWEVTGNRDGHQLMRETATNDKGVRCTKGFGFSLHPGSIRTDLGHRNTVGVTPNTVYIEGDVWSSIYSLPGIDISSGRLVFIWALECPLESEKHLGIRDSLNKILEFGRSGLKSTTGSPQCFISCQQVTRDLLEECKEMLAHALQTYHI